MNLAYARFRFRFHITHPTNEDITMSDLPKIRDNEMNERIIIIGWIGGVWWQKRSALLS